jgi:FkbM family methyltransferase
MLYRLLYHPAFNKLARNLIKTVAPRWNWKRKIPVSGTIKLSTGNGDILVKTNPTSFATKHIFWDGLDNFEYVPIFKELIKKVDSFIDIGANTGIYSTLGAICNPDLKVFSFEPSKGPYEYLKKNIAINQLQDRVFPYNIALSDKSGEADFYEVANLKYRFLDHNLGGVGNLSRKISHRHMFTSKVKVEKLDSLTQSLKVKGKVLVKIDTEATEDLVLRGMSDFINRYNPIIICETLFNRIEGTIEAIMKNHGYLFYNHLPENNLLNRVNSIKRDQDDGIRDCFLIKEKDIILIKDFI